MVLNISLQLKPTSAEKVGLCAILETIEGCGELDPSTIKKNHCVGKCRNSAATLCYSLFLFSFSSSFRVGRDARRVHSKLNFQGFQQKLPGSFFE